jgi:hypothetical protein
LQQFRIFVVDDLRIIARERASFAASEKWFSHDVSLLSLTAAAAITAIPVSAIAVTPVAIATIAVTTVAISAITTITTIIAVAA